MTELKEFLYLTISLATRNWNGLCYLHTWHNSSHPGQIRNQH